MLLSLRRCKIDGCVDDVVIVVVRRYIGVGKFPSDNRPCWGRFVNEFSAQSGREYGNLVVKVCPEYDIVGVAVVVVDARDVFPRLTVDDVNLVVMRIPVHDRCRDANPDDEVDVDDDTTTTGAVNNCTINNSVTTE